MEKTTDRAELGSRIRALRMKKGLSLAEFGKQIHVSKGMVEFLETGYKMPSLETTKLICSVLNTSLDYLVYGIEQPRTLNVEGLPEEYIKILASTLEIMRRESNSN